MAYQRGVFFGVVQYTPSAPFSVKFMRDYVEVETFAELSAAFKREAGALPFSVLGKLRPVLALTDPSYELGDVTALRLVNISRRVRQRQLTPDDERAILEKEHPYLFPLAESVVRELSETRESYAVVMDNPIVLNESAMATTAVGEVSEEDFAELCERFIECLELGLPGDAATDDG